MTQRTGIWVFLFLFAWKGSAQISPGDLTRAHAKYEGMSNCTLCHDLGNKVTNAKCLDCHKEMQALLDRKRGYHSSKEAKGKDCTVCHSEHHGRKFDMLHFDALNFDHDLTGYPLKKRHAEIDCKKCHMPDKIRDPELKKRKGTFLGLEKKCLSCHDDYHQKTLDNDCAKCHNEKKWRPAPKFDHDDAKYKLEGKHVDVDCKKCHPLEKRKGQDFQVFTGLSFKKCVDCHKDPHLEHLPGACAQCHDVQHDFKDFRTRSHFNHGLTKFKLRGKHKSTACFECHKKGTNPKTIFQDQLGVREDACVKCHEDKHGGKFGTDCAKCHNERSFLSLDDLKTFDHSVTDYPLEGQHTGVECKSCHKGKYTDPLDFSRCDKCHEDYHRGVFAKAGAQAPDCVDCHSLSAGFDNSAYGFERHAKSDFPLEGGHEATPCFACHLKEDKDPPWQFREIGKACVDCHDDIHNDFIPEKYYPDRDCARCHDASRWSEVHFAHDSTGWSLEGKHMEVACRACHFKETGDNGQYTQKFVDLDKECFACHDNVHGTQFEEEGKTDCKRCHDAEDWEPRGFDHSKTAFPLDGKHKDLACQECHKIPEGGEIKDINYKIEKFECIDCHGK